MKPFAASVEVRALKRALAAIVPMIAPRGAMPVLTMVKLEAESYRLIIVANDLDADARIAIPLASGHEMPAGKARNGKASARKNLPDNPAILVSGARLLDAVRQLPPGEIIHLAQSPATGDMPAPMTITTGAGLLTLSAPCPVHDFPDAPYSHAGDDASETREMALTEEFAAALRRVRTFMSDEDTRYYLNGIFVHQLPSALPDSATLAMVATDGHRLGRASGLGDISGTGNHPALFADLSGQGGFILPKRAVHAYLRMFSASASVRMTMRLDRDRKANPDIAALNPVSVTFEAGEGTDQIRLVTKLIDGTFPDYQRIIPADPPHFATVDRLAFAAALKLSRVFRTRDSTTPSMLSVQSDGATRRLVVDLQTIEGDGALLPVPLVDASDDFEPISFNPRYMQDLLASCTADDVKLRTGDKGAPAVIEDQSFLAVVMPMRGAKSPRRIARDDAGDVKQAAA